MATSRYGGTDVLELTELGRLAAAGELRVHVRETFPFERTADALARVGEGRGPGRVVVIDGE